MIDDTSEEFINRHIGPTKEDQLKMLGYISKNSLKQLINETVPENILLKNELNMAHSLSESEALKKLKFIAQKNQTFRNFIGMGYYNCFMWESDKSLPLTEVILCVKAFLWISV